MAGELAKWARKGEGKSPYMVLPKGGTGPFSCANCRFMSEEGGEYRCSNASYQRHSGGALLTQHDEARTPLDDPSRACSNWFEPKET